MDFLIQIGINWVITIQALGGWLEMPMRFFTFLGSKEFFFLVLPLLYWCVDSRLGLRVAMILVTSTSLNYFMKLWFAGPRPYWVSAQVKAFTGESSFGIPSGHAQNAISVWGLMAEGIRARRVWMVAFFIAFFIGFSRVYLGVHFPHDVLTGWFIGGVLLWAFLRFWDSVTAWLKTKSLVQQIGISFAVSMILILIGSLSVGRLSDYIFPEEWMKNALRAKPLPDPVSLEDTITSAGTFFGLALGAVWIASRGGYQASGPVGKRALRYIVGLIGILILLYGLDLVFPDGNTIVPYIFRYIRYLLVGFWILGGAPWLFFRFKLVDVPKVLGTSLL